MMFAQQCSIIAQSQQLNEWKKSEFHDRANMKCCFVVEKVYGIPANSSSQFFCFHVMGKFPPPAPLSDNSES